MKPPMQPLVREKDGQVRFQRNRIVRWLLDWASPRGMSLNDLALMDFSDEDRTQFAQLIGYSLNGYSELPYVSDDDYEVAAAAAKEIP